MKTNVGGIDRTLRIVAGIAILAAGFFLNSAWWVLLVGAIVLATGLMRFCGAYTLFGISTCNVKQD
jgi:hypothetical protein